jgi:hypothetical protein
MLEVVLGVIVPVAVAVGSWMLVERTYRRAPAQLTSLMVGAFAAKMVLYGAYVGIVIGVLQVRPRPFVVSFTAAFIVSYAVEAFYMRRLFE